MTTFLSSEKKAVYVIGGFNEENNNDIIKCGNLGGFGNFGNYQFNGVHNNRNEN